MPERVSAKKANEVPKTGVMPTTDVFNTTDQAINEDQDIEIRPGPDFWERYQRKGIMPEGIVCPDEEPLWADVFRVSVYKRLCRLELDGKGFLSSRSLTIREVTSPVHHLLESLYHRPQNGPEVRRDLVEFIVQKCAINDP